MGHAEQKAKSSAQAAYMKERGITRRTGRCPICNGMASLPMDNHIRTCKGGKRKG